MAPAASFARPFISSNLLSVMARSSACRWSWSSRVRDCATYFTAKCDSSGSQARDLQTLVMLIGPIVPDRLSSEGNDGGHA
jgi:hypothetical protein